MKTRDAYRLELLAGVAARNGLSVKTESITTRVETHDTNIGTTTRATKKNTKKRARGGPFVYIQIYRYTRPVRLVHTARPS